MSTEAEAAAQSAQTEAQTTVQEQPAAQQAQAAQADSAEDPKWLGARLDRERKSVLKQLGVDNVEDAKLAIDELRKRRDSEKTETERLRAELDEAKKVAAKAKDLESVVALQAETAVASLSESQREAVLKLAGDDPTHVLRAIEALRPTWAEQKQTAQAAQAAQAAQKQAPLSTSSATPSPTPGASEAESITATYERLERTDPQGAARFKLAHLSHFFRN